VYHRAKAVGTSLNGSRRSTLESSEKKASNVIPVETGGVLNTSDVDNRRKKSLHKNVPVDEPVYRPLAPQNVRHEGSVNRHGP